MKSFLLFAPRGATPGDSGALENAEVVRDSFTWLAFLAPTLWFLYFRLWLAALVAFLVAPVVLALAAYFPVGSGVVLMILLAVRLFIGLEAGALRARSLRGRGYRLADAVVARNGAEAENMMFRRWLSQPAEDSPPVIAAQSAAQPERRAVAGIVGLFPEPEGGR